MPEGKESMRWLEGYRRLCEAQQLLWEQAFDTRLVYLADRAADLFEIYTEHQQQLERQETAADWLIRARHDRNTASGKKLWSAVEAAPELGRVEFDLPASKNRKGPKIVQSLQALRITLMAPQPSGMNRPIEVTALLAREVDPPARRDAHRMDAAYQPRGHDPRSGGTEALLVPLPLASGNLFSDQPVRLQDRSIAMGEDRTTRTRYYALPVDRLARAVLHCLAGRECPELPCNVIFDDDDWQAVYIVSKKQPPPRTPPLHSMK
ncbi:MAG: hypothetical protein ACREI9_11965 [Nitrospiraceae bacterium]